MARRRWPSIFGYTLAVAAFLAAVPGVITLGWLTTAFPELTQDATTILGPGCPSDRQRGFRIIDGHDDQVWRSDRGGYAGKGCNGQFLYTTLPAPTSVIWRVNGPGPSRDAFWCTFEIHIPASLRAGGVASYRVYQDIDRDQSPLAQFTLDQAAHRNDWVRTAGFTATGSITTLDLMLLGTGHAGQTITADAAFVGCIDNFITD
jgi:hypothetical protein